jgi:hypothetical protein
MECGEMEIVCLYGMPGYPTNRDRNRCMAHNVTLIYMIFRIKLVDAEHFDQHDKI